MPKLAPYRQNARSNRWTFPLNEKFCALRIANALQSHRKGCIYRAEPDQTAEAQGAVNSNVFLFFYELITMEIIDILI